MSAYQEPRSPMFVRACLALYVAVAVFGIPAFLFFSSACGPELHGSTLALSQAD